jgi:4-hydroxy-3-polyprenylbenzoate decarboxylase
MDQATRNGAIIMPPVPAFYTRPQTVDDIVSQTVGRALDLFGLDAPGTRRWTGRPWPTPDPCEGRDTD